MPPRGSVKPVQYKQRFVSETHIESSFTKPSDTPSSEAEKAALIRTLKEKQVNAWSAAVTAANLSVPSGHRAAALQSRISSIEEQLLEYAAHKLRACHKDKFKQESLENMTTRTAYLLRDYWV